MDKTADICYNSVLRGFATIICVCILFSSISALFTANTTQCTCIKVSDSVNREEFSELQAEEPGYEFKRIQLTPCDESLLFGQVDMFKKDTDVLFDIFANLYIINGNVYGGCTDEGYYLYVDEEKRDELKRDGDGLYKLKKEYPYKKFKEISIRIVKEDGSTEKVVCSK